MYVCTQWCVCVCCVCVCVLFRSLKGLRDAGDFQFSVSIATLGRMGTASVTLVMVEERGEGKMEGRIGEERGE